MGQGNEKPPRRGVGIVIRAKVYKQTGDVVVTTEASGTNVVRMARVATGESKQKPHG